MNTNQTISSRTADIEGVTFHYLRAGQGPAVVLLYGYAETSPEPNRQLYAAAYARPGRMRVGWAYFVSFQKAADDFAVFAATKLSTPVLAIGGEKANGAVLTGQMKLVADDVTVAIIKNTGHWLMEESP
jgi:pimeloyl-ACP methyl ester carboxylesterase